MENGAFDAERDTPSLVIQPPDDASEHEEPRVYLENALFCLKHTFQALVELFNWSDEKSVWVEGARWLKYEEDTLGGELFCGKKRLKRDFSWRS